MTEGTKAAITPGCSKRLSSKAATSEEARRYVQHFVGPFDPTMDLGERKSPFSASGFRKTLVEPLSDVRTPLADFFSILLNRCHNAALRYLRFDIAGSGLGSSDACGLERQNRSPDSEMGPG